MGHSINSVGYRLGFYKNWKYGVVARSSQFPTLFSTLDSLFDRFFNQFGSSFLYSHFSLFGSPIDGKLHLTLFFYNQVWQRFLRLIYRQWVADQKFIDRNSRRKPGSVAPSRIRLGNRAERLQLRFLKSKLEQGVCSLLAPLLFKNLPFNFGPISVRLVGATPLTPPLFARYILFKLKRRYSLARVINSFLHLNLRLLAKGGVVGVFFRAAGRFSKTQRASALSIKRGKTPFSTISTFVDQFSLSVNLKYGSCNLTVWVAYNNR